MAQLDFENVFDCMTAQDFERIDKKAAEYYACKRNLDFENVFDCMTAQDFERIDKKAEEYYSRKRKRSEQTTMADEDQYSEVLNGLYKKRIAGEKRMLDDYMKRERDWRTADAIKPDGLSQQFLWEEQRKEREFNENQRCKKRRKLYEFVSTMSK